MNSTNVEIRIQVVSKQFILSILLIFIPKLGPFLFNCHLILINIHEGVCAKLTSDKVVGATTVFFFVYFCTFERNTSTCFSFISFVQS